MAWGRRRQQLDRGRALAGRPERVPVVRQEERPEGELRVTLRAPRPRWLRWWMGRGEINVSFDLDYLGREVYEACDGKSDVKTIMRRFAQAHNLGLPEAELAVTTFLQTMMRKGLVAMVLDQERTPARE